jgi:hypothetical protein
VRLAGGEDAEILVMTIATQEVSETIKDYRKAFRRLGARHVKGFDISLREDTTSKRGFRLIEESTGLFFTGGNQLDIPSLLGGTEMLRVIQERHCCERICQRSRDRHCGVRKRSRSRKPVGRGDVSSHCERHYRRPKFNARPDHQQQAKGATNSLNICALPARACCETESRGSSNIK